jgi:transposase
VVGGDERDPGEPRDDESGDHGPGLDAKKKTRRASERDETKRTAWREQTRDVDPARFVWVDETGSDLGMTRPYSRAPRGQRAYGDVPGRRGKNRTLITALTVDGFGPGLLLDEAIDRGTFEGSIIHRLAPTLQPDQIVVVDNLTVHYSDRAKAAIEARGAQLWYLPTYSPDLTPIEEACSKVKAALRTTAPRTVEAHSTAVWAARRTITPQDAEGWIAHAGYGPRRRPTRSSRRRPTPIPASRFPDAPPVIVLHVPTPILFDHLW